MNKNTLDRDRLKRALLQEDGAIKIKQPNEEPFVLAAGVKSRYFLDMKLASLNPKIVKLMVAVIMNDTGYFAKEGTRLVNKYSFDKIAAVAVGAIPLGMALTLETGLPLIIVRSAKFEVESPSPEHLTGTRKDVIGDVKGKTVLIIDDVASTGESILTAAKRVRSEGGICNHALVIVDREEGEKSACHKQDIELRSLLKRKDLL